MVGTVVEEALNSLKTDVNSHFFGERTTYDNYNAHMNLSTYYNVLNEYVETLENPGKCKDCRTCDTFIQKICRNLDKITITWEQICSEDDLLPINCNDYFIYWLYGKIIDCKCTKKEINCLYSKLNKIRNCRYRGYRCIRKYLHIEDINVLKNKKELYDFTEYYSDIKSVLNKNSLSNKDIYCKYIDYIFHLYEKIHKDHNALYSGYYDENIEHFKTIFNNVTNEVDFLEVNCSNVKVDLVLDKKNSRINKIKQGLFNDFVNGNSQDLQVVEGDPEFKDSPLNKFYSRLDGNFDGNVSIPDISDSDKDNYIKKNSQFFEIWKKIHEIQTAWKYHLAQYDKLSSNKTCEYFNYWLYDKLKDNSEPRNVIPFLYRIWELFTKEKYCKSKKYAFHIEQIPNKKRLHDFVEIYDIMKGKLNKSEKSEKEKYCKYIKIFFDLYKHMEQDEKGLQGYRDEIIHFQSKFYENVSELTFLNNKCPGKCLKYIFTNNYKRMCSTEEEQSNGVPGEVDKLCRFENKSASSYVEEKNDLIASNSEIYKMYNEFSQEDNNVYYKKYCTKLNTSKCQNKGVDKICVKLVKNLIHLSNVPLNNDRDERCYLLKHWLYDEIRKKFGANYNDVSKEPVIAELKEVVYRINNNYLHDKPCYCEFVGTLKDWKEEKELHDYFQSYDKIESNINADGDKCNNYFNKLVAINKIYEEHLGKCCYCYRSGYCYDTCPDYFKCDDKYNPYKIFLKLDCTEEISKNFKKVNKPQGIDYYVITESIKSFLRARKSEYDLFFIVTQLFLGILGILMIFFIFYKFTPLGRILHKNGYSDRTIMNNMRENFERELAQSTSGSIKGMGNTKKIHLAYQTA